MCENCGHDLGFLSSKTDLLTLKKRDHEAFSDVKNPEKHYRFCRNSRSEVCNWLIPVDLQDEYCIACKLNAVIPNLNKESNLMQWRKLEIAKHRLVYSFLKLRLPLFSKSEDSENGLGFDFLSEEDAPTGVVMGHAEGLITINLAEADDAKREAMREKLGEPYRTLMGHFRHESGHYYWDRLIKNSPENLNSFRDLFGNEGIDYNEALQKHYKNGPPLNWADSFVSAYATAHPWEDWAETWAHYLHIIDTLETAYYHGLKIHSIEEPRIQLVATNENDPFNVNDFKELINLWYPLTVTINNLNRSMGQRDFYPFVIAGPVVEKLKYIHHLCQQQNNLKQDPHLQNP